MLMIPIVFYYYYYLYLYLYFIIFIITINSRRHRCRHHQRQHCYYYHHHLWTERTVNLFLGHTLSRKKTDHFLLVRSHSLKFTARMPQLQVRV